MKTIRIRAGALRGIVPEQLLFWFGSVNMEGIAEGATLEVETLPIGATCKLCGCASGLEDYEMICLECESKKFDVKGIEAE